MVVAVVVTVEMVLISSIELCYVGFRYVVLCLFGFVVVIFQWLKHEVCRLFLEKLGSTDSEGKKKKSFNKIKFFMQRLQELGFSATGSQVLKALWLRSD